MNKSTSQKWDFSRVKTTLSNHFSINSTDSSGWIQNSLLIQARQKKRNRSTILRLTNCRNLPFGGRATRGSRVRLPREENMRSRHQRLFQENVEKTRKVWPTNFKCETFESCFYAWGRYQHPTRPSHGMTTFNQVCKYDFKMFYFPFFLCLFVFLFFLCFFVFFYLVVVDTGCCRTSTKTLVCLSPSFLLFYFPLCILISAFTFC